MGNPFAITFGKKPEMYIPRIAQRERIIQDYNSPTPSTNAYMLVGVRGSGKTVLLSEIAQKIGPDWIVINLNSQIDMLASLTSQLYSNKGMHKLFVKAKIDLSFMNLGAHIEESVPVLDNQTAITRMLEELKRQNRKLLLTIDEVSGSKEMKAFSAAFQIFIRENLPIFLVMAGIPKNVYSLIDDKGSTFLYRAPRIDMTPLNAEMIQRSYVKTLKTDPETARQLALLTGGYPFAYQVLGHVCWGKKIEMDTEAFEDILAEYDYYLYELSYSKIWSELSEADKSFLIAVAEGNTSAAEIQEEAGMDTKKYSVYRDRLIKQGVIAPHGRGIVCITLPRFDKHILSQLY